MWFWKVELPKENEQFEVKGEKYKAVSDYHISTRFVVYHIGENGLTDKRVGSLSKTSKKFTPSSQAKWREVFAYWTCEWKKRPGITNRKWLSKMSDEELAEWLCGKDKYGCEKSLLITDNPDDWIKWLKDEHKEDKK